MSWIMTAEGWRQLRPRRNDIIQPGRVEPLRASGRYIAIQDPLDYDDQGRYLHDPKIWRKGELEAFRKLLDESKSMGGIDFVRGDPASKLRERGFGRFDKWGVRVMT